MSGILLKLPLPKSAKEKVILGAVGPAMGLIDEWTKDIKPENDIAEFLNRNFHLLLLTRQSDEVNGVSHLLVKMMIAEANVDPEFVEHKLLGFYEEFRNFYREYKERKGNASQAADTREKAM